MKERERDPLSISISTVDVRIRCMNTIHIGDEPFNVDLFLLICMNFLLYRGTHVTRNIDFVRWYLDRDLDTPPLTETTFHSKDLVHIRNRWTWHEDELEDVLMVVFPCRLRQDDRLTIRTGVGRLIWLRFS